MRRGASSVLAADVRAAARLDACSMLAIETHGLGKRFGDRVALDSIDLEVPRGTAFGFLGRNGGGKTTLVRLLLGLARPTSGSYARPRAGGDPGL
jgi:ABC-type transporter Mla maintaining outer membrane lipid asymmetry ATPase subunit MlaF